MSTQSLRLSEDAVIGSIRSRSISSDALQALRAGDTAALIASHRERFGGWTMMAKNESEEDDDEEDSEDDDESDDDDEDEEDSDDSDDDSDDDEDDGPEGKKSKKAKRDDNPEGLKRKITALEDEKNRLFRGREKARQRADELQKQLDKVQQDGTGDDQLKQQVSTLESANRTLTEQLQESRLANAFLSDNTYEWHDPGVALRAVNLSDLEIDDDGTVHGLKSQLEKLATDKPFLLKTKTTRRRTTAQQSSGRPAQQRKGKKASASKAENARIAEKYGIRR